MSTVNYMFLLALLFATGMGAAKVTGQGDPGVVEKLVLALDGGARSAETSLRELGGEAVIPLCRGFARQAPSSRLRRATLLVALAEASHSGQLAALLEGEDDTRVKLLVVFALGRRDVTGWRDAIEIRVKALSNALRDPERVVRETAMEALSAMDEEAVARVLAGEARRRSSPFREKALRALAEMESAWQVIPGLLPMVRRELPGQFSRMVGAAGKRYSEAGFEWVVSSLGMGDQDLRSAAQIALNSLDDWFFKRRDHRRRLALYDRVCQAWPWNLESARKAALVTVLDDRELVDSQQRCLDLERLLSPDAHQPWAGHSRAHVYTLQGIDHFLAGRHQQAAALFRRAWNTLQGVRARHPEVPQTDVDLAIKGWLAWRLSLAKPMDKETQKLRVQLWDVQGGPQTNVLRSLLRDSGRIALLAAVSAFIGGDEKLARSWLLPAREMLVELEKRWDSDYLGNFGEQDEVLGGDPGVIDLLVRGLGRNGRWEDGEKGFVFLLTWLARFCPDFYVPLSDQLKTNRAGGEEKAFSRLTLRFVDYLVEAGKREQALQVGLKLEKHLRGRGLAANQGYRMRVLFRLAGIYSDLRKPDPAEKMLEEFLAHYRGRKAEIEQHPEDYGDPVAARRWVDSMLAQGHVSIAVLQHVLRGRDKLAAFHCRRAFKLEGGDFNRVLYACYLARQGQRQRATELAEGVDVAPGLLYNLACTWALLGKKERALVLLKRDLQENYLNRASRNNHREWAAKDPDFAGLYAEAEFKKLVRKE